MTDQEEVIIEDTKKTKKAVAKKTKKTAGKKKTKKSSAKSKKKTKSTKSTKKAVKEETEVVQEKNEPAKEVVESKQENVPAAEPVVDEKVGASKTVQLSDNVDHLVVELLEKISSLQSELKKLQSKVKSLDKNIKKERKSNEKLLSKSKKKNGKKKAPSGFAKPTGLSKGLCAFLGVDNDTQLARTSVTKQVISYIKSNNLQDPNAKKTILPDDKLEALLQTGGQEVTFFNLQTYMTKHFSSSKNPVPLADLK